MTTFTTTLPDDILDMLRRRAEKLSVPKERIIEKALRIYIDLLNRAEYVESYKEATKDTDIMSLAEEGMVDYLKQLEE
jgi:predicted transcriptional regulator